MSIGVKVLQINPYKPQTKAVDEQAPGPLTQAAKQAAGIILDATVIREAMTRHGELISPFAVGRAVTVAKIHSILTKAETIVGLADCDLANIPEGYRQDAIEMAANLADLILLAEAEGHNDGHLRAIKTAATLVMEGLGDYFRAKEALC